MSTRSIIEINHDYWEDLERVDAMHAILMHLHDKKRYDLPKGIRMLGQRHHTETLKLEVK